MKNSGLHPLLIALILFFVLISGFFLGRLPQLNGIMITSESVTASPSEAGAATETVEHYGRININTADIDELMLLPGIGPTLAERIVLYRQDNGPFSSTEELIRVKGIGTDTLSKLSQFITVGG